MDDTKQLLIKNIKNWMKIDNEIADLKQEVKNKMQEKKTITNNLINIMKNNDIDCFDVNGGSLVYKKNIVKKPISTKMLLQSLQKYYDNEPEVAREIGEFILENREEIIKETIVRKIYK